MIKSPFIVKEKTQRTILNGNPDLALPEQTGCQIGWASDKGIIRMLSELLWEMAIILDQVLEV
jgi:hypothetical protein